jgi:two-component system chemotaxis sensor kinase CheA
LVIVEAEGRRVAVLVDELTGQQQVVIKSLEQNYRKVEAISGATILGDGQVALILDVPGLAKLARLGHVEAA